MPQTMKLLRSTKSKLNKDKNSKNKSRLEIAEVLLIHCSNVNKNYQQGSRVLYTFVSNKGFGKLLDILPQNLIFLKTFNSEYLSIVVWLTGQNSKPLEIEDKINITLVIN